MSSPSVERVLSAARIAGLELEIIEYPDGTRSAVDAAVAVGCVVDQIVKSMIFSAGEGLVLALTSGAHQVDPIRLAAAIDVETCGRANADRVREKTGFAIGGVAPFGHLSPLTSVIDPHLLEFETVWAAAGTPRHVFAIDPKVLQTISAAAVADFVT